MAMDAQQALQLASLLAQHAQVFTQSNPGQNALANHLMGSAQAGIMAEAQKKARKEEEKKEKGLFGGKVGSVLGTAAGMALAPATGGASLALAGGLGGLAGGVAGQYAAGSSPTMVQAAGYGLQGAMDSWQYGKAGDMSSNVQNAAQANLSPSQNPVMTVDEIAKAPLDKLKTGHQLRGPAPDIPSSAVTPSAVPTAGSSALAAQTQPKQGFIGRFMENLGDITGMKRSRVVRNPDGSVTFERAWP